MLNGATKESNLNFGSFIKGIPPTKLLISYGKKYKTIFYKIFVVSPNTIPSLMGPPLDNNMLI